MKKILTFLLVSIFYSCIAPAQTQKICQMPQTTSGSVYDYLIKEDSDCSTTQKITIADFIATYLGASGGLPASPLNSLQFNNGGVFGAAMISYSETSTQPFLTVDTLKELTIGDKTGTQLFHVGTNYVDMGSSGGSSVLCQGNDITLTGNTNFTSQSTSGLYKYLGGPFSSKYGTLDFTSLDSNYTYSLHNHAGHLELSEAIPIDYADLSSAVDGKYILIDGFNPGLIVTVLNGKVSPIGYVSHTTVSRASFTVDTQIGSTSGTLNVLKDATTLNSTPISWADTDPDIIIAANIAAGIDLSGYSAFTIGATVYILNNDETNGGVLTISTASGDTLITTGVNNFAEGLVSSLAATYNYSTDAVTAYSDGNNNKVSPSVTAFPFNDAAYLGNDLSQDGGSNFSNSDLGNCQRVSTTGDGKINAAGSNASISDVQVYNNCTLNITSLTGGETVERCQVNVGKNNSLTLVAGQTDLIVNTEHSNYEKTFTLTTNTIDFNEDASHNWVGVVNVGNTGTKLKKINGLQYAPKFFRIKGCWIDFNDTDATIIMSGFFADTYSMVYASSDLITGLTGWIDAYTDGTNVYLLGMNAQ